jgi:hypothetical protein
MSGAVMSCAINCRLVKCVERFGGSAAGADELPNIYYEIIEPRDGQFIGGQIEVLNDTINQTKRGPSSERTKKALAAE